MQSQIWKRTDENGINLFIYYYFYSLLLHNVLSLSLSLSLSLMVSPSPATANLAQGNCCPAFVDLINPCRSRPEAMLAQTLLISPTTSSRCPPC